MKVLSSSTANVSNNSDNNISILDNQINLLFPFCGDYIDMECPYNGDNVSSYFNINETTKTRTKKRSSLSSSLLNVYVDNLQDSKSNIIMTPQIKFQRFMSPMNIRLSHHLLGRGRQGSVWLGEDIFYPGKFYAVKIIEISIIKPLPVYQLIHILNNNNNNSNSSSSSLFLKNINLKEIFKKETSLWQNLYHPNIVKLYGIYSFIGNEKKSAICYLYSEYMSCGSLLSFIQTYYKKGRLYEETIRWFLKPILKAINYMHMKKKIIHQDIKAENIFVTWKYVDDNNAHMHKIQRRIPIAKLGDFGCARYLKKEDKEKEDINSEYIHKKNINEMPCGTVGFIPPEIILNLYHSVDACSFAVDIWSFGCTILQLLHGISPVRSHVGMEDILYETAMYPTRIQRFIPPSKTNIKNKNNKEIMCISSSLRDLLLQCLQPNPKKRPSAAELLQHPFFLKESTFEDIIKGVKDTHLFYEYYINDTIQSDIIYNKNKNNNNDNNNNSGGMLKSTTSILLYDGVLSSDADNEDYSDDLNLLDYSPSMDCA